jgi:polysaccharide pyruvyl transferase WcaK-like protein
MIKNLKGKIANRLKNIYNDNKPFPKLRKETSRGILKLTNISAFNYGNAGDTVLPVVLRDLFNDTVGVAKWKGVHVFSYVNTKILNRINKSDAIIIGGGGLFLKDTNPNDLSGWQWSCSIDQLKKIKSPIIMFAVGYNRFRGQEEFEPVFKEHLNAFVSRASFVGIRNRGSIRRIKEYLDDECSKEKLIFQPCMTTVLSKIYPDLENYETKENFIAVNCAFDREKLRSKSEETLKAIARVVKKLAEITEIRYYSHMITDKKILRYFDELDIKYKLVEFSSPKEMVHEYAKARLVIGMRGHAQMIPFGCKTPILSIISHDKLKWFLEDISHLEWGADVQHENFESDLYEKALNIYSNYKKCMSEISVEQDKLWEVTLKNMETIKGVIEIKKS